MPSRSDRPAEAISRAGRDGRDPRRRPDRLLGSERGSVTAEFAAVIPAVVLVLGCCLGSIQIVGEHVRLTDAAAVAARALSRGDDAARVRSLVQALVEGASLRSVQRGEFVCAQLASPVRAGLLAGAGLTLEAASCALAGGL